MTTPIPQPPGLPLIGNLASMDHDIVKTLEQFANTYGEYLLQSEYLRQGDKILMILIQAQSSGTILLVRQEW